jgi:hypothetical protein
LTEEYHRTASGSGNYGGTWKEDGEETWKFLVKDQNDTSITVSLEGLLSWSSTATGSWIEPNGGAANHGQDPVSESYTVDKTTLEITAVCDGCTEDWMGHPAWFMLNPTAPRQGDTLQFGWWKANSDAKSSTLINVPFTVGVQSVVIKGVSLQSWVLTYSGNQLGFWRVGDVYSKGTTTDNELFDVVYGVNVGWSESGQYEYTGSGGGWTETYSSEGHVGDTNLTFKTPVTVSVEPPVLSIMVDGVVYTGDKIPVDLYWEPGTTHSVQVNSTYQGAPGTRYIFEAWSDGSNETARTMTASQPLDLKAIFKTQYELKTVSNFGSPQGAGWYDADTEATVSISPSQPDGGLLGLLGSRKVFQGWRGDFAGTSPTATIKMDSPKAIEAVWGTDETQAYVVLVGIIVLIVVIVLAILLTRRRAGQAKTGPVTAQGRPVQTTTAGRLLPASAPTAAVQKGFKHCIYCGNRMHDADAFCGKCGKKQE